LNTRVINDTAGINGAARTDPEAAKDYFELLAPTSAVIETASAVDPGLIRDIVEDTIPPWMTLVRVSQHIVTDIYEGEVFDGAGA
jgi:hypothetical protein